MARPVGVIEKRQRAKKRPRMVKPVGAEKFRWCDFGLWLRKWNEFKKECEQSENS